MKPLLAIFAVALLSAIAGAGLIGANLGGLFVLVAMAALLPPIAGTNRPGWSSGAATVLAIVLVAGGLLTHRALDVSPLPILMLLASVGLAGVAMTRLLATLRLNAVLAGTLVVVLGAAWLLWPIWASPWMTSERAGRFVEPHPLLALSAALPQFGYWTHTPSMYRLSNLGQDVMYQPPTGMCLSVAVHLLVALLAGLPEVIEALTQRHRCRARGGNVRSAEDQRG